MSAPAATPILAWVLGIGGLAAVIGATLAAARASSAPDEGESPGEIETGGGGFAWIVIAGFAYAVLALAAASIQPRGDGLRAAVLQMGAVLLAAALGVVSLGGEKSAQKSGSHVSSLGVVVAWLSLVGLPPTLAFHGKLLVYRSLLQAGWGWLTVIALVGTAAALVPAFRALTVPARREVTKSRAMLISLLVLAVVILGVYPQAALSLAALLTGSGAA
ncbi:MAG: hypothetical protein JXA57_15085 [Armatimonadetes bacterium]|nr:hypothetical protein [Armatimonadota bacterium]